MQPSLKPIMVGLLATTLPALAPPAWATEHGRIAVADPRGKTHMQFNKGDTFTFDAPGAAIDVSVFGNSVQGNGIIISAGSTANNHTRGVAVSAGGAVHLFDSMVQTLGNGQSANALAVSGADSVITATGGQIATRGNVSHGAYATNGGRIDLQDARITSTGNSSAGLQAEGQGSSITSKNALVTTQGSNASGAAAGAGATVALEGGRITAAGGYANGVTTQGADAQVRLANTAVFATTHGARLAGGRLDMTGGSLSGGESALLLDAGMGAPSSAVLRNASFTSTGTYGYGLNINARGASATADNVAIAAQGVGGTGVWLAGIDTAFSATRFDIASTHVGLDNRAGQARLTDGTIRTLGRGAHGLYVSHEYGASAGLQGDQLHIDTRGESAIGVFVRLDGATVSLRNSTVLTHGEGAHGLQTSGAGARLSSQGNTVRTNGSRAVAAVIANRGQIDLDNTRLEARGPRGSGVWSYQSAPDLPNTVTIANGSQISTQDGAGLAASGGNHRFTLSDTRIVARTGGDIDTGVLLRSDYLTITTPTDTTIVDTGRVSLQAARSLLTGDVVAANGSVDLALADGSVLTGAMTQRAGARISGVTLDASSTWYVRGDSTLGTLANAGTVAFVAPTDTSGFKTLTVHDYAGGGMLVLNARLGGDASATDRLVIDGGAATGKTALRLLNAGGAGGQTVAGISLVQTVNGGTTAADAFHLDPGSTGYRASAGTLAVNGYDYSLVRGDAESGWYLTSRYTPPAPPDVVQPVVPGPGNVSPESGAYLGNRLASAQFFSHGMHDRNAASGLNDAPALSADGSAGDGSDPSADNALGIGAGRRLWTRIEGRQDSGLRLSQGRVGMDADSTILQLGGDLIRAPLNQGGAVYAGLMGGYGDARTRSTSTLMLPGGATVEARARGKVSGYSMGVYGTVYQDDATRMGAYADTWLQYGRYSNQINSELGSTRYHSTLWSASIEAGYALKPFADGSVLGPIVIEPHAQLIYSRYDAQDATLQGTRMRSGNDNAWNARIGARLYPQATANAPAVRPFLEANWLHSFGNPSVNMGPNTLDAALSRNSLELKLGAEGRVSRAVQVSGHVFGQAGNNNQRGYGGMLNVGYRW